MFDTNLLFSNAQVVAADGYSTNPVNIKKTGAEGVWIEIAITAKSGAGVTALNAIVLQKDTDSGWDYTAVAQKLAFVNLGTGAPERYYVRVQSYMQYLKLYYDITSTANDVTITAGIVSGPQPDACA